MHAFSEHMRSKYRPIQAHEDSIRTVLETGYCFVPDAWRETIEMRITAEELKAAVFKEKAKNLPAETV